MSTQPARCFSFLLSPLPCQVPISFPLQRACPWAPDPNPSRELEEKDRWSLRQSRVLIKRISHVSVSWKNPNSSTARKDGARRKLICPRSSYCRDILLSPPFIVCHLLAHERTLPPFIPFPVVTPHTPRAAAAPATVT